ncbi:MAG: SusE domain-containing protein [Prevotella sp.]
MKTKIFSSLLMITALILGTSCTSDMEYKDVAVTPVKQLLSPKDGQSTQLLSSATANVFFEWTSALAEDGNAPLYEVVFDKESGDFSNPIYRLTSDGNGSRNFATISHKTLDKIAQLAGLGSGETGTLKWTVVSSRGINQAPSSEVRTIKITRLLGFSDIPAQVFITGAGSEAGADDAKALAFSSPASGEYEIYTKLVANQPYYFIDTKTGDKRVFFIDGTSLKESLSTPGSSTVSENGVYRINLDFNIATASLTKVVSVGFFFSPSNQVTIPLTYQSNGIWVGSGATPFKQESWGRDQRYKFEMVLDNAGTQTKIHWGPTNASLDSAPSNNEAPAYFQMKQYAPSQWDQKWKLNNIFDTEITGNKSKFTFYLNADGPYHHTVEIAK